MNTQPDACNICTVVNDRRYMEMTEHGIVFEPDNKLCEGHLIVAPRVHVSDALVNPVITAQVMRLAAMRAKAPCTIVIPVGREAQQWQPHMYVHILPSPAVSVTVTPRVTGETSGNRKQSRPKQAGGSLRRRGDVSGSS